MKRYFVIATKWDSNKKSQIKYIAGEFTDFVNAMIFRDAYSEYYQATAHVVEENELLNK